MRPNRTHAAERLGISVRTLELLFRQAIDPTVGFQGFQARPPFIKMEQHDDRNMGGADAAG